MTLLPRGWVETAIGQVTRPFETVDPTARPDDEFVYVDIGSIDNKTQSISDPKRFLGRDAPSRARRVIKEGDVLFATVRTYLKNIVQVPSELDGALTSTGIAVLRPTGCIDGRYLFNWVCSDEFITAMSKKQDGTLYPAVTDKDVASGAIRLPPLREQQRIVTKVDGLSARTARARAELLRVPILIARYKQRLLSLAFSGELTENWRNEMGVPSPIPALLSDAVAIPVRNGLSVKGSDQPPGIRALRLSALRGSEVNMDDVRYLPIDADRGARFALLEDDILISRGNGTRSLVGIGSRVPAIREMTIFPDTAFRIRLAKDRADPRWFVSIWNSPQVRTQIEKLAKTTAGIWKVAQSDLARVELLLPTPAEQAEITRRIELAFGWLDRLGADSAGANRLLTALDAVVLSKALRGELLPQDPDDEPASALLERVRREQSEPRGRPRRTTITSKDSLMAEQRLQPSDRILQDSENWPASGLPVTEVMSRNPLPHDELRDALFDLLSEPAPRLRQEFDPITETMMIKRVAA